MRFPRCSRASRLLLVLILPFVALAVACVEAGPPRPQVLDVPPDAEQYYFAIEMKGTLAGYAHLVAHPAEIEGRQVTLMRQKTFMLLNLLGSEFNTEIDQVFHVDPTTGMSLYTRAEARQGRTTYEWSARREGDVAHMHSTLGGGDKTLELPADVIFGNPLTHAHLKRDFVDGDATEKSYQILELREAEVQEVVFTRVGEETLELRGESWETVILDEDHRQLGLKLRVWLDRETAMIVQVQLPNERRVFISEPRVVRKIEVANLTEDIASKVGVLIADFQSISYMKVRAVFQPTGMPITPEMLNVPGQRFEGTVVDNRVDGVFEIRHRRYDGTDAPAFPPDFSSDPTLREYLEPSMAIESADPVLIDHARQLTEGARDSWDAATRISRWVADNIQYAIPGGGTARRTFDQRAGECGSHSVLVAALNRAVGIPARLVWGCQYIPNYGGAFGQHGWNEVYMGDEIGWVPIDATSYEIDYVDSGHIRIGAFESAASALNPIEAEILAYQLDQGEVVIPGETETTSDPAPVADRYRPYVGKYKGPRGAPFSVRVENDSLVVDVEGRVALPLLDPDSDGIWRCKLTPALYVLFELDEAGTASTMWIHEIATMRKIADATEIDAEVPPELHGHLGTYLLAQINMEFTALWQDGNLAMRQADNKEVSPLMEDPDEPGTWVSQVTGNRITFDRGEGSEIVGLTLDSASRITRQP